MNKFLKKVAALILLLLLILNPYFLGSFVCIADDTDAEEEVFYYLTDHLGGIDAVVDENGLVVERTDYLPFGDERMTIGDADGSASSPQSEDYGFTGKEKDDETGLNYYGARYYDSKLGRFTQIDSYAGNLADPQSLNKYSYVLNNPIKFVDPNGEKNIDYQPYIPDAVNSFFNNMLGLYKNSINVNTGGKLTGSDENPYQCTELAKRFSQNANGINLGGTGNGVDYGNQSAIDKSFKTNNPNKAGGYTVYKNGGNVMPKEDDIISWKGGVDGYGHVAIITEVVFDINSKEGIVYTADQNRNKNQGLFSQPLKQTFNKNGNPQYTVGNSVGKGYNVEGWARYDTQSRLPSAMEYLGVDKGYTSTPYCPATKTPIKNSKK